MEDPTPIGTREVISQHGSYEGRPQRKRRMQLAALRLVSQAGQVVYAIRTKDGLIKIGCTGDIAQRTNVIGHEVLGLMFGDFDDEAAIHDRLVPYRAKGHEWYHPTPEVLAVVNEMRADLGLEPLAA